MSEHILCKESKHTFLSLRGLRDKQQSDFLVEINAESSVVVLGEKIWYNDLIKT